MQLLAPMMMVGAAAVTVPVALHFFYRARYKPLPWAPMRFLKEAIEQTSRRLKFQEWILLALRCLALILLALAISRPGSSTATLTGRGDAVDAVIIIDTSYSMSARDGEKTRLERAKAAARAVVDTLPAGSSVQVFTCSTRATKLGPMERFNFDEARQLIDGIRVSSQAGDLLPGLTDGYAFAKAGQAPAKEVYVFTDMQADGFKRQGDAVKAKCEEIKAGANLVFVRCGNAERKVSSVAVENVTWHTDIPHTRTRVPFVITLRNTGAEPVKGVKVSLELDGKAVEKDAVQVDQIDPGQAYPVTLTGSLDRAGVVVAAVKVENDAVPGDDVMFRTLLVREKVRVLLVDGTPKPENPTAAGDHFVKTALNPARIPDYYIESESVAANEASPRDLEDRDIVYLLNAPIRDKDPVAGMSPEFTAALSTFVEKGGGLVIASGDLVDPTLYNKTLGSVGAGSKLLPFDLKDTRNATETSPFHPAADTVAEPSMVEKFRKSPYAEAFQGVALTRLFGVDEVGGGRVLARTTGGYPYIASKVVGAGEVVLVTGSLDEAWGTFSSDPGSFHVPLAIFTVTHLTGRKVAGGTGIAGAPLTLVPPAAAGTAFELVSPPLPGEKVRPRTKLDLADVGGKRTLTTTETQYAGVYHIVPAGKGDADGAVFAVNPDLTESAQMAIASDRDVAEVLGYGPPVVQAGADTQTAVTELRTRSEWTEWVLLGLLVLLIAEAAWAWVCGRAW